jgi:hypothetical protein
MNCAHLCRCGFRKDPTAASGETVTRRAITVITAAIVVMTFGFSLGNVTKLCLDLGITAWIAWLVGLAVDLSMVGLLIGMRFLSLHGYADDKLAKPQYMMRFCGILALALNTSGACGHWQIGTALVDAVGPALLIGWSEVGPWMLRQIYSVCLPATSAESVTSAGAGLPSAFPADLLARARELDAVYLIGLYRPILRRAQRVSSVVPLVI